MNNIVLVGRIKEEPKQIENQSQYTKAHMCLEVRRNFRNSDGLWDSDLFQVTLWRGIAEEIIATAKEGDLVTVKGRLQASNYTRPDGTTRFNVEVIAEQVAMFKDM